MMQSPFDLFANWHAEELQKSTDFLTSATCLSTCGLDDYPNARFVSLKEVTRETFVITGPLNSRKGEEIAKCNKVALTFWWTNTQRQVRIQGVATLLPEDIAENYFHDRPLDAKIISTISMQGGPIENIELLRKQFDEFKKSTATERIPRPLVWGGYSIKPIRLEFMEFRQNRFHERYLYQIHNGEWISNLLQP